MEPWWKASVGYEVYIRSFADGNGDGVGDFHGLRERLEHLAWLGIDLIWVTPFFPSPMRDAGYDVADYCDVDPAFGDLAAFDAFLEAAHERGMRVIIDFVPNHTSSDHPWFQESRSSRDNPKRDWYVWADPAPDGGPPNNWRSTFGGPAWTFDDVTGQYWLHLFLPEQPDVNWRNPEVVAAMHDAMRFWLDRGVDGFRIDVAHMVIKDEQLRSNPPATDFDVETPVDDVDFEMQEHLYDTDQAEALDVHAGWRAVAAEYDALLVGEIYLLEAERMGRYVRDQQGVHLSFWFKPLHLPWDPDEIGRALQRGEHEARGYVGWVQGSHDKPRAATRWGGGEVGSSRALAMATLLMGLPGVPFIYQGEELGLEDVHVPLEHAHDPVARRLGIEHSRDGCRTPMPWEPAPSLGFTSASEAWLPFGERAPAQTAAVQRDDESSMAHRYRALVQLRRALGDLHDGELEWISARGPVLAYRRGMTIVAANCGDEPQELQLRHGSIGAGGREVRFSTCRERDGVAVSDEQGLELAPYEAVVVVPQAQEVGAGAPSPAVAGAGD